MTRPRVRDRRSGQTVAEALARASAASRSATRSRRGSTPRSCWPRRSASRREALYAEPERELTAAEAEAFEGWSSAARSASRSPTSSAASAFARIELQLNENTLIPRPETETLVEVALEKLAACDKQAPRVLDIGTGSGNIALALAAEHPTVRVVATEVHPAPLEMARLNAARLGFADRVRVRGHRRLRRPAARRALRPHRVQPALRHPRRAAPSVDRRARLRAARRAARRPRGLDFYERIVPGAPEFLEPGGWLAVEIPDTKFVEVLSIFVETGRFEEIDLRNDLGGAAAGRLRPREAAGAEGAWPGAAPLSSSRRRHGA